MYHESMSDFKDFLETVPELPEIVLKRSPSWVKWSAESARCIKCGEMSEILSPCCGTSVSFEGGFLDADDLWTEIGQEIAESYDPDLDAQLEDLEDSK
jgi:hypothetical protein